MDKELADDLEEGCRVARSTNDPVDGMIYQLGAVIGYLKRSGCLPGSTAPLFSLLMSLHDLKRGSRPDLLLPREGRSSAPHNRPADSFAVLNAKAFAAALADTLMKSGDSRDKACQTVARGAAVWGIPGFSGEWKRLAGWRDRARSPRATSRGERDLADMYETTVIWLTDVMLRTHLSPRSVVADLVKRGPVFLPNKPIS